MVDTPRSVPFDHDRALATGALTGLIVLQVLVALAFLLVVTTVPARPDLQAGPPLPVVAPVDTADAPPPVDPGPAVGPVRATRLDIPKLGIAQNLIELGVDPTGVLQPPDRPDVAGWFPGAAAPGEQGPTVIAGHVDSRSGPGVFFALKDLARGDLVDVGRSDGRTATYRVTGTLVVDKDEFPTWQVYGPTAGAELRLITCGGGFDRSTGHYLRNVVVSAVLVPRP